jgi:ribosome-associated toxin RatA of RatAB toxin-antitoxin module
MAPAAARLLACLLWASACASGAEVTVRITRAGDVLHVDASAVFEGTIAATWPVLTDYGRLADFVPDLHSSRVIARNGNQVEVEQKGQASVLFVSFPIDVRLAITEHPYERVESRAIGGNFRELQSTYRLEEGEGRVLLRYTGRMLPDFYVPPLIGTLVLRRNIEAAFHALVNEIERAQARPRGP